MGVGISSKKWKHFQGIFGAHFGNILRTLVWNEGGGFEGVVLGAGDLQGPDTPWGHQDSHTLQMRQSPDSLIHVRTHTHTLTGTQVWNSH